MADVTDVLAIPFPEGGDTFAATDVQGLAERVDEAPGIESLTAAEIAALTSAQKPAGRVVYNSDTSKLQVSNGTSFADVDAAALAAAALKLPLAGGTMSGNLAMGSNKVTGLAAATANGDAVRYEQLTDVADAAVPLAGGTMTGTLIIDEASEYSQVVLRNNNAAYWISTDPGAGDALSVAVLDKTTLAYTLTAFTVAADGKVTFPQGIRLPITGGITYY